MAVPHTPEAQPTIIYSDESKPDYSPTPSPQISTYADGVSDGGVPDPANETRGADLFEDIDNHSGKAEHSSAGATTRADDDTRDGSGSDTDDGSFDSDIYDRYDLDGVSRDEFKAMLKVAPPEEVELARMFDTPSSQLRHEQAHSEPLPESKHTWGSAATFNVLPTREFDDPNVPSDMLHSIIRGQVDHFIYNHPFTRNPLQPHTTSERRDYTRDVYDFARARGLNPCQARVEVKGARLTYRKNRRIAKVMQWVEEAGARGVTMEEELSRIRDEEGWNTDELEGNFDEDEDEANTDLGTEIDDSEELLRTALRLAKMEESTTVLPPGYSIITRGLERPTAVEERLSGDNKDASPKADNLAAGSAKATEAAEAQLTRHQRKRKKRNGNRVKDLAGNADLDGGGGKRRSKVQDRTGRADTDDGTGKRRAINATKGNVKGALEGSPSHEDAIDPRLSGSRFEGSPKESDAEKNKPKNATFARNARRRKRRHKVADGDSYDRDAARLEEVEIVGNLRAVGTLVNEWKGSDKRKKRPRSADHIEIERRSSKKRHKDRRKGTKQPGVDKSHDLLFALPSRKPLEHISEGVTHRRFLHADRRLPHEYGVSSELDPREQMVVLAKIAEDVSPISFVEGLKVEEHVQPFGNRLYEIYKGAPRQTRAELKVLEADIEEQPAIDKDRLSTQWQVNEKRRKEAKRKHGGNVMEQQSVPDRADFQVPEDSATQTMMRGSPSAAP